MAAYSERGYLWFWITRTLIYGFIILVTGALLWPVSATDGRRHTAALGNVKQLGTGVLVYVSDYDERLPFAASWMDELLPYVKDKAVYNASDGEHKITGYGFAFRRKLSGRDSSKLPDPNHIAILFDSLDLDWNANGGFDLLPVPGRHGGKNAFAFADGHARMFTPGDRQVK